MSDLMPMMESFLERPAKFTKQNPLQIAIRTCWRTKWDASSHLLVHAVGVDTGILHSSGLGMPPLHRPVFVLASNFICPAIFCTRREGHHLESGVLAPSRLWRFSPLHHPLLSESLKIKWKTQPYYCLNYINIKINHFFLWYVSPITWLTSFDNLLILCVESFNISFLTKRRWGQY